MRQPSVSIIIPTHSRPHLLPRAVESAKKAGTDVEVIVIDDASRDETAQVCARLDGIKYVRCDRNRKVAGARNLGILASSADYISFLDDDDVRLPGTLDIQVKALETVPEVGLVYGQVLYGNENCVPTDQVLWPKSCPQGDIFWELFDINFIPCQTAVFRKSCLFTIGLLDETIPGVDDWDLWIRIAEIYPVAATEQPFAIWRTPTPTSGQGMSDPARLYSLAARAYRRRWLKLPRATAASTRKREELWNRFIDRVSDMLIWRASYELTRGHTAYSRKNLLTALRLHPFRAARPWTFQLLVSSLLRTQ
ncbi:MAG: glycosyltransferase family 2 protein [Blastocatellales bacterium]